MSDNNQHKTTTKVTTFRPLPNGWPLEFFDIQQNQHWLPNEVDLISDYEDYKQKLTHGQRQVLQRALMLFTQMDAEVATCYIDYYIPHFKAHDVRMMLMSFANMESIHMLAYDKLNSALKLPTEFYGEFLKIKEMYEKYDFMQSFDTSNPQGIALTLALVSGFAEGVMLFASFAIIVYFPQKLKCMTGVGQIVTLSMRDESLHVQGVLTLFHKYVAENADKIDMKKLHADIVKNCKEIVHREIAAIDSIYGDEGLKHLPKNDLIDFVKYFADLRLRQLKVDTQLYGINDNPLPWMDDVMNLNETVNFFESVPTGYSKALKNVAWDID